MKWVWTEQDPDLITYNRCNIWKIRKMALLVWLLGCLDKPNLDALHILAVPSQVKLCAIIFLTIIFKVNHISALCKLHPHKIKLIGIYVDQFKGETP